MAQACGVSPATVSNVLANKPHVSEATRKLVHEKVSELGYRASATARGFRLQRSWSVALVIGDIANPFNPEVVRGVEDTLWEMNNNLILCNTDSKSQRKIAYVQSLLDKQIDGLIMLSQSFTSDEVAALDLSQLPPIVTINRTSEFLSSDHVALNNESGTAALMGHLISLDHQRIAFIKGLASSSAATARFDGYRKAMEEAGLQIFDEYVAGGDYTMEAGAAAARYFLDLQEPPTAIFAANDLMALGVLGVLRERQVNVPQQISVAGFDDIDMSAHPLINLTTVRQPKRESGIAAARLLLERIASKNSLPHRCITIEPELVIRGTTAPPGS
ncbi:Catabolite control protein A [compost metagenome]